MISKTHTKYIQSLQHKKFRDAYRVFIAEGPKVVTELLTAAKFNCREIYAAKDWLDENSAFLSRFAIPVIEEVKEAELEKISALSSPHKVLAVFDQAFENSSGFTKGAVTLALDTIQDPGNFGTIIRIADWFGIEHIVCAQGCADMYSPKVVQSTMGSLSRIHIHYTDLAGWLQQQDAVKIYGADMNGKDIRQLKPLQEGIIVIGNEGHGMQEAVRARINEFISILGRGRTESLNAAVATGIILSHLTGTV